jgi:hypothetical protein
MRSLIAPAALVFSLAVGSAAFAATPAPAASAPAKPAMATTKHSTATKKAECEKAWKSQKSHTGTEAAFVKACVAKG